jgi:hypothetical protein
MGAGGKNRTDPKFRKGGEIRSCPHFADSEKTRESRDPHFAILKLVDGDEVGRART